MEVKRGNCDACGIKYDKEAIPSGRECYLDYRYEYQDCPECGYNPRYGRLIKKIVKENIRADIKDGRIKFNINELSHKISSEYTGLLKKSATSENLFDSMHNFHLEIFNLVARNFEGHFNFEGKLVYSSDNLSDLVNKKAIEHWPQPEKKFERR